MSRRRVLVVDDHDLNLKLMMYLLATVDCDVITASTAQQAQERIQRDAPALVLLDLQLPDMDGLSLTRLLRADARTSQVPIVAVTAYAMKGDEERARAAGVDYYLTKPVAKNELRALVTRLLGEFAPTLLGAARPGS